MADNRTVKVTLVAVAQPYTKGMNDAAGATRKLGGEVDRTGDKAKGFGTKVNGAKVALAGLAAAGAAVAGTALVSFLTDAVAAAGDLEQSVGGVDAVFKDSADQIHDFGRNSAEAVGLSRNEFNKLVTVSGALLKNKGLEDFTERSLDLVTVGADLAATFGGPTKDAVDALNAAMRGEADPIERYGISINQTAVNAELAARGLADLEGEAKAAAETQARLDLIMRQSADATGAFAREADTLQGQQQRLSAEWEDAKASLGEAFLPALTDAVAMIREGVDAGLAIVAAFEKIPTPVLTAAAALGAVHVLGGPLGRMAGTVASTMGAAREALRYAGDAAAKAGGGFSGAAEGVRTFTGVAKPGAAAMDGLRGAGKGLLGILGGPWGIAFMGAAVFVGKFISDQREARREADELRQTLDDQTGAITENTEKLIAQNLESEGVLQGYEKMGGNVRDLTDAILGDTDARQRVIDVTREWAEANERAAGSTGGLGANLSETNTATALFMDRLDKWGVLTDEQAEKQRLLAEATSVAGEDALDAGIAIGTVADESANATPAVDELGRTEEEAAEQTKALREEHDALIDSLVGMVDAAYGAIDAEIAYEAALDTLTEAVKENGETHDISTEKGRANMEALTGLAEAARNNAAAQFENGESLSAVTGDMMAAREEFIKGAEKIGYTTAQANDLADQLGLTADKVSTLRTEIGAVEGKTVEVKATGPGSSAAEVDYLKRMIDALGDKTVTVYTRFINQGGQARAYNSAQADGGMWDAGHRFMADGGFDVAGRSVPRVSMMGGPAYGKRYITWGEDETNWEGYVSGKPGMESRSKMITSEIVRRLGGSVTWAADGMWSQGSARPTVIAAPAGTGTQITVPVQTYERVDPAVLGAAIAWEIR